MLSEIRGNEKKKETFKHPHTIPKWMNLSYHQPLGNLMCNKALRMNVKTNNKYISV